MDFEWQNLKKSAVHLLNTQRQTIFCVCISILLLRQIKMKYRFACPRKKYYSPLNIKKDQGELRFFYLLN